MSDVALDLAAEYPELEIYPYGWHAADELELIELGDRVSNCFTESMFGAAYSRDRDRVWAAVSIMFGQIVQRMRDQGLTPQMETIPHGWVPDTEAWDAGRVVPTEG